jgi:arginase
MEFAPESTDAATHDLAVILRILGSLTGPTASQAPADAGGAR